MKKKKALFETDSLEDLNLLEFIGKKMLEGNEVRIDLLTANREDVKKTNFPLSIECNLRDLNDDIEKEFNDTHKLPTSERLIGVEFCNIFRITKVLGVQIVREDKKTLNVIINLEFESIN